MSNYAKQRREDFRRRGYHQIELWLPEGDYRKMRSAASLRGDRGINDVLVEAIAEWLANHSEKTDQERSSSEA